MPGSVFSLLLFFFQTFLNLPEKPAGVVQILCVRMTLGDAAHHFKRTKGIVTLAEKFPQNGTSLGIGYFRYSL